MMFWHLGQVQSNALAALEALDTEVAEKILSSGCVTGDRINGLCDGETGKWWAVFSWTAAIKPRPLCNLTVCTSGS